MKYLIPALTTVAGLLACSGTGAGPSTSNGGYPAAVGGGGTGGGGGYGSTTSSITAGSTGVGGSAGTVTGVGGTTTGGAAGAAVGGTGGVMTGGTGGTLGVGGGGAGGAAGGAGGTAALSPAETLYLINCYACHGPEGRGSMNAIPLGPEIQHPEADFATYMVRNGSMARNPTPTYPAVMAPISQAMLTDADLVTILNYLNSFPKPVTGQLLYEDFCANCHGKDGHGGSSTHNLTTLADLATKLPMMVRDGKNAGMFQMLHDFMPMRTAAELTDAELMLITTYVDALP